MNTVLLTVKTVVIDQYDGSIFKVIYNHIKGLIRNSKSLNDRVSMFLTYIHI